MPRTQRNSNRGAVSTPGWVVRNWLRRHDGRGTDFVHFDHVLFQGLYLANIGHRTTKFWEYTHKEKFSVVELPQSLKYPIHCIGKARVSLTLARSRARG